MGVKKLGGEIALLRGKRVVLGVTGGIAAYKAVEVASRLRQLGAGVHVAMTPAAARLVAPLTFQAVSGQPVHVDLLDPADPQPNLVMQSETGTLETERGGLVAAGGRVPHVALAQAADLLLIAPATADALAKLAAGMADDYVTVLALAARCPVLVCPAMESHMYQHPATQRNISTLRGFGYRVLEPAAGHLASGATGIGRLPEPEEIVSAAIGALGGLRPRDLEGRRMLVTAGATREPVDPVRYLSNRSSGRMGVALAEAARDRGAVVTLVHGPLEVAAPSGVELVPAFTAREMRDQVLERFAGVDVVIKAAAVADYRPARPSLQKLKKGDAAVFLEMELNPDILSELGQAKQHQVVVGFAAETGDPVPAALDKLFRKRADLIVANDVALPDSGFGSPTNRVWICEADGHVEALPAMPKRQVADMVLDPVVRLLEARG